MILSNSECIIFSWIPWALLRPGKNARSKIHKFTMIFSRLASHSRSSHMQWLCSRWQNKNCLSALLSRIHADSSIRFSIECLSTNRGVTWMKKSPEWCLSSKKTDTLRHFMGGLQAILRNNFHVSTQHTYKYSLYLCNFDFISKIVFLVSAYQR